MPRFTWISLPHLSDIELLRIERLRANRYPTTQEGNRLRELVATGAIDPIPRPHLEKPFVWDKYPVRQWSQREVVIDAMDVAYTYGERYGMFDFLGLSITLEAFFKLDTVPLLTVVMFEHELDWWRSRDLTPPDEVEFREALVQQHFFQLLDSTSMKRPPRKLCDPRRVCLGILASRGNKAATAAEAIEYAREAERDLNLKGRDVIRAVLYPGRTPRTLGQWEKIIKLAQDSGANILCNQYEQVPELRHIDSDLIEYVTRQKLLYLFLNGDQMIVCADTTGIGQVIDTPS